jgi:YidC/Oxa1 family membrane protein insertase
MLSFFHTILYVPMYNFLIFLVGIMPHGDVGLAIVGVVIVIRIIILPLSLSMVHTQNAMQKVNPEIQALQVKYKDDKETLAKETFALYKKYKINPFASILTLFIQLPILFTLYFIVRNKTLYTVNTALLYPFVHAPALLSPLFLGFIVISSPNIILAALAAGSQFLYGYYGIPVPPAPLKTKNGSTPTPGTMQEEFGRAMTMQMRYFLPLVIGFVAYSSGVIALYFIVSNVFMLLQTVYINFSKKEKKLLAVS